MILRPTKLQAIKLVTEKAPEYLELFREFQLMDKGWLIWPERFLEAKQNLKLDYYVTLYEDQKKIDVCLSLALLGKEEFKNWSEELKLLSEPEKITWLEDFTQEMIEDDLEWMHDLIGKWPETPEEKAVAKAQFEILTDEQKKESTERATYLFLNIFCHVINYFSLMTCGEKLTSLVPKALAGDEQAFFQSVKSDRNLLLSHPYFIDRYRVAQEKGERDFLQKLSRYQSAPALVGKISYPGLYVVFSILDSIGWLDDLPHAEILDICDSAGLDRWENRIEDVNYLTKRLAQYRKYQKTGGVSMH